MARFYGASGTGGGDVSFNAQGCIEFPNNGEICNVPNSSGDGSGFSTISITPDTDLVTNQYHEDQYLIIDPTAPNHIHIRAGGTQDASGADLFIGGEENNVRVSDGARQVSISTKPPTVINTYTNLNPTGDTSFIVSNTANIYVGDTAFYPGGDVVTVDSVTNDSPSAGLQTVTANLNGAPALFVGGAAHVFSHEEFWTNGWLFGSDGYLTGPAMGGLLVSGLLNGENDLWLSSNDNVVLNGNEGGEFLGNADVPGNQIATIGDITSTVSEETSFTVAGGTTGTQPTFTGAPLFSGSYVKVGKLVHFQIQVDMDNITNFGTGQYYVDLPFTAKYGYQVKEGCLHDISTSNQYAIGGHVAAGADRLFLTYTNSNGQDSVFDHDSPVTLNVADNFHISGTYITAE
jgi:hypothetical protein